MSRRKRWAIAMLASLIGGMPAAADDFAIVLEVPVSNGVPGPGAGFIEVAGGSDTYALEITAPTVLYLDELAGACTFKWSMTDPLGASVFSDPAMCVGDPGILAVELPGTYTITVTGTGSTTGAYSFVVWEVDPAQEFAIGLEEPVSNGVPGPGAGFLEEPGAVDMYTFEAEAGTTVYFDELSGNCAMSWSATAPSGALVFADVAICVNDPGVKVLPETGTYLVKVMAANGATGPYAFTIWTVEPAQTFAIGLEETVSDGVPAPGAGNLEEPGAVDIYTLPILAGSAIYFNELGGGCAIQWTATAPSGSVLFADPAICVNDPGEFLITETGLWTLAVSSIQGFTGTYSFTTNVVSMPDTFDLEVGRVVSNGVPGSGAGNIESPGAVDLYLLTLEDGADVCFKEIEGNCSIGWTTIAPDGQVLFADPAICVGNPGRFIGVTGGTYSVIVSGSGGATGTYSFVVVPGAAADLDGDCTVGGGDIGILLADWGPCPVGGTCQSDLDGDGVVGGSDLGVLLAAWGEG
ncbi:MAG: hypothetical protein KDA22_13995 [Phycisphaerales bacterium]|nr:hypothetical protein [Phycisphaerales bacterium]